MLIILCIILFRISCNFSALGSKLSALYNYSQDYFQDHCQNNPEMILYCNA